ncbi:hypothetical protein L0P88_17680 [Muricauda sp. SCSIO 64092]|uniref:hypothetical protein n=1 Tax=Allomuricauda sp. SCSIO 64092 TaxID=2908842 RepID=UPI001FF64EF7|nr:hypothetical protein [Muricauda sp. SCSIO 64092]UOY05762.1 hypothetical protein L0P88_17680 [Muricauda sp. SCSIO 64092]
MKKNLFLIVVALLNVVSCTKNDDGKTIVESEHTGVEGMIIKAKLDITLEALGGTPEDYPFIQGQASSLYGASYIGYVLPAYGNGNTSVTATFLSSTKEGFISYNGKQYNAGDSFNVVEFFNDSHSVQNSDVFYVGTEEGMHGVKMKFVSNRGTTITTDDSFFFQ